MKTFLFQATQFRVKTVPFQAIPFSISTQFISIWPTGRTLSGATILGPSYDNERVLHIPQSSSITGTSPSDCLVSNPGRSLMSLTPLQRISQSTLHPQPTGQSRHFLGIFTMYRNTSFFKRPVDLWWGV